MKARVKATGEIVDVIATGDYIGDNNQIVGEYKANDGVFYTSYDLDFYVDDNILIPDYWERLKHQYAGMAMQGILSNQEYVHSLVQRVASREILNLAEGITKHAEQLAHALVEKMKNNNNNQ